MALASATMARSASCIIGQCPSVLTLMMCAGSPRPLVCCTAPLTPNARYRSRVDDHAGGADLAFVRHPAAVGDDTGGTHAGADGRRRCRRAGPSASAPSSPAPPPTMRGASARSIVAGSGGSTASTMASRWLVPGEECGRGVDHVGQRRRRPSTATPRTPGCSVATNSGPGLVWWISVPTARVSSTRCGGHAEGAGVERAVQQRSEPRREVAAVGRPRHHHRSLVHEERREGGGPGGRAEVAGSSIVVTWRATPANAAAAAAVPDPMSTARPPHSATVSSPPDGSTPSRVTTTAIIGCRLGAGRRRRPSRARRPPPHWARNHANSDSLPTHGSEIRRP